MQVNNGHIGIVTVTFNSDVMLQDFLDSLSAQTYRQFTLYAVDNVSTDRTLEILRRRADLPITVIPNSENVGVAQGNNQGIVQALADGCDEVLLINNDTTFAPDMLEKLHQGLAAHHCDMTTGKMYYFDRPNTFWAAGGEYTRWPGFESYHEGVDQEDRGQFDQDRRITYTPTCLLLVRRSVFDHIGLMDPQYFAFYDDADFLLRCKQAGLSLWFVASAKLWHKVGSLAARRKEYAEFLFSRNRMYFARKHTSPLRASFWYVADNVRFLVSRLIGHSSASLWKRRRDGMAEGRKMQLPAAGPHPSS